MPEPRSERIFVRLSPLELNELQAAAEFSERKVSTLVREGALERARAILSHTALPETPAGPAEAVTEVVVDLYVVDLDPRPNTAIPRGVRMCVTPSLVRMLAVRDPIAPHAYQQLVQRLNQLPTDVHDDELERAGLRWLMPSSLDEFRQAVVDGFVWAGVYELTEGVD